MFRFLCKSKIKGGRVTEKKLYYEGSITVDADLLTAADILPGEMVHVLNTNSGARIETYVIKGRAGSGEICLNGPAARFFELADPVIILSQAMLDPGEIAGYQLRIVELTDGNKLKKA